MEGGVSAEAPTTLAADEAQVPTGAGSTSSSYLLLSGSRHLGAQAGTGSVEEQHSGPVLSLIVHRASDRRLREDAAVNRRARLAALGAASAFLRTGRHSAEREREREREREQKAIRRGAKE
jgi:hypothetical protein